MISSPSSSSRVHPTTTSIVQKAAIQAGNQASNNPYAEHLYPGVDDDGNRPGMTTEKNGRIIPDSGIPDSGRSELRSALDMMQSLVLNLPKSDSDDEVFFFDRPFSHQP